MTANLWKFPLAVGAVLAMATVAAAAAIVLPTDSYLCYKVGQSKAPVQPKFAGQEISSKDQFEPLIFRNFTASKIAGHCNPTLPSPAAGNAAVHLVEYKVKDSKTNPNAAKFVAPGTAFNLADRFGMVQVTVSKPRSVLVRSGKGYDSTSPFAGSPAPVPFPTDLTSTADYTCYEAKGPKLTYPPQGPFDDQFGQPVTVTLNKITEVCAPTNKGNGGALGPNPSEDQRGVHLICYKFKLPSGSPKFGVHYVQDGDPMILPGNGVFLDAKKRLQLCVPALKAAAPAMPSLTTPTKLIAETVTAGGVCGSLTTNMVSEGVPGRLDPSNASVNPNAVCTAAGMPKACCTGSAAGHCNEDTTITCGSLTFGGGGAQVLQPGTESANSAGSRTRYALSCGSATGVCTISGDPGDIPNGIKCSQTGCASTTPVESTSPINVCAISALGANATGSLDLATGTISLPTNTASTVYFATMTSVSGHACPRCRSGVMVSDPEVFATGPSSPGVGVCDNDSVNAGTSCTVFEPAGPTQGLSADCTPMANGSATISITTTNATAGASVSDPAGHFCPGQAGNPDCVSAGNPNPCCTGPGSGCTANYNGCFGSGKYADTPATCTGISITGSQAGFLLAGDPGALGTYGAVGCIPAIGGAFGPLVNGGAGLPGPVAASSKVTLAVQ